jgi:hypothetical protein
MNSSMCTHTVVPYLAFLLAASASMIIDALDLPVGEPMGLTCHDLSSPVVDGLFPAEAVQEDD